MTTNEIFSQRLKELRGDTSVKDRAAETGLSATALYKAEGGQESVTWKTIDVGYSSLLRDEQEYADLLMLWAMTQSDRPVALYRARAALDTAIVEEAARTSVASLAVVREVEAMPLPSQLKFARLAALYRRSEIIRKIADVWLEYENEWRK